jgi:hypothetical protein
MAVLVLAVVVVNVYAVNGRKTTVMHNQSNHAVLAASSTSAPSATPSPTNTPTPTPAPKSLPPASAKAVFLSVPKISISPASLPTPTTGSTPSPTAPPIVDTPDLENWYSLWAKNTFTAIWENFGYMEYYANESNIAEINNVCWQFGEIGQQNLKSPTAPDATVAATWSVDMNELVTASSQCQSGIANNDATTATKGLDLLQTAGVSLKELQGELNPADAAQINTIIANAAISG